MPFTLAHPALVVPLARRWPDWLPLSALVMGSMAPDLIYLCSLPLGAPDQGDDDVAFLGILTVEQQYGHGWPGAILVSLPTAFAMLYFFHRFLKWPLVSLFPPATRARLIPAAAAFTWTGTATSRRRPPAAAGLEGLSAAPAAGSTDVASRATRIALALLVGILTHVLWDGFTHNYGWAVRFLPGLMFPISGHGRSALTVAEGEQIACSVLGLALLAMWWRDWLREPPADTTTGQDPDLADLARRIAPWKNDRTRVAILTLVALASVMIAAAKGLWVYHHMGAGALAIHGGASTAALWLVRLLIAALALYSLIWRAALPAGLGGALGLDSPDPGRRRTGAQRGAAATGGEATTATVASTVAPVARLDQPGLEPAGD